MGAGSYLVLVLDEGLEGVAEGTVVLTRRWGVGEVERKVRPWAGGRWLRSGGQGDAVVLREE